MGIGTIVVLGLLQVLDTVAPWQEATSWRGLLLLAMRALLALGLAFRWRLAWAWVRYFGLASAILNPLINASHLFPDGSLSVGAAIYVILGSGLLLYASWTLGQPSATSFFELSCPQCGRKATGFTEIPIPGKSCRGCSYVW